MAKKGKDDVPNPNSVANRDILQRLNFLYQASQLLGSMGAGEPLGGEEAVEGSMKRMDKESRRRERNRRRHPATIADLSATYVKTMKTIGTKTNIRMDSSVKRTICKGCSTILSPGVTAKVRVNASKSHGNVVSYQCLTCKTSRRIPAPPVLDSQDDADGEAAGQEARTVDSMAIDNDPGGGQGLARRTSLPEHTKRRTAARPLPFFERNVGHIVFKGNEQVV